MLKKVQAVPAMMAVVLAGLFSLPAFAQSSDPYSPITGAVNWATVTTDLIVIFAAAAAFIVVFVGGKVLLRAIKGAH